MPGNTLFSKLEQPSKLEDIQVIEVVGFTETQIVCSKAIWDTKKYIVVINCVLNACIIPACALVYDMDSNGQSDTCLVYLSWDIDSLRQHELRHCMGYNDVLY